MKKRIFAALLALCSIAFLAGCGNGVDENKTPAEIRSEAEKMSVEDIQAMIVKYQKAIEEKAADLKKETEKLAKIPLKDQLGEDGKAVRAEMAEITKSLNKLKENAEAYAQSLKAKQK